MHTHISVVQLNVNHCAAAQSLLAQTAAERNVDIMLLSEPYVSGSGQSSMILDETGKAAIKCCSSLHVEELAALPMRGIAYAKLKHVHLYSCYAPPSDTPDQFEEFLEALVDHARGRSPKVIAGDFNAWAVEWGSRTSNTRGRAVIDAMGMLDLILLNDGRKPTFNNDRGTSFIDVTFVSRGLVDNNNWMVHDVMTLSDHALISFSLSPEDMPRRRQSRAVGKAWDTRKIDEAMLAYQINSLEIPSGDAESMAAGLMNMLGRICDAIMPRKNKAQRKPPVYWWSASLSQLRSDCLRARRMAQRARGSTHHAELLEAFRRKRLEFKHGIAAAKARSFKELQDGVDSDTWGLAYKLVTKKLRRRAATPSDPGVLANIVGELFPKQTTLWRPTEAAPAPDFPCVTELEVAEAAKRIKPNKAPGLDGIPGAVIKAVALGRPEIFRATFQQCLLDGIFPTRWKSQKLVLLPKGKGPAHAANSYRPLCLLDIVGKLFERILYTRIEAITESINGLGSHQYGFRKGKSTLDALSAVCNIAKTAISGDRWLGGRKEYCAIVTLDVRNAFNTARWPVILAAMYRMGIPEYLRIVVGSYFRDRVLWYDTEDGPKRYRVSAGVPQGSVLGPILWNIMYDGILGINRPVGVELHCFADDVAITAVSKTIAGLEDKCNSTIGAAIRWLEKAGLAIAAHKTEAVLLSSRKKVENMLVSVKGTQVTSQESLKYLGVMIDRRLSFKDHASHASKKAAVTASSLARLMPNVGGPRHPARKLLVSVAKASLLYAAPVWSNATGRVSYLKGARSVLRSMSLRLIRGFRTISEDAALALAGLPPIDLEIKALSLMRSGASRQEAHEWLLGEWQSRWQTSRRGRWTYQLIPEMTVWAECQHKCLDYHLTQFLTDHGCFRAYLLRFRHVESAQCLFCVDGEETAEHVLMHCSRFTAEREQLKTLSGSPFSPSGLFAAMMANRGAWERGHSIIINMMKRVRSDEMANRVDV